MADLISKKALIEKLGNTTLYLADEHCLNNLKIYDRIILEMPCIDRWIPVSERLPEDFQRVLLTVVNYNGNKVVRVAEYYDRKKMFYVKETDEQWEVGEKGLLVWMSLPEPYKEVENGSTA